MPEFSGYHGYNEILGLFRGSPADGQGLESPPKKEGQPPEAAAPRPRGGPGPPGGILEYVYHPPLHLQHHHF